MPNEHNIILIGMPGAGKSTIGVLLAKHLAYGFVDTDVCIQQREGMALQAILEAQGYEALRRIEEEALMRLRAKQHVIATGGSAVYSDRAMKHLGRLGPRVFLDVSLATVKARVSDVDTRGIACPPGYALADVYRERAPLYRAWADVTVSCDGQTMELIVHRICEALARIQ